MGPMDCPHCGLVNPPDAQRCDCGYDFTTKTLKEPHGRSDIVLHPPKYFHTSQKVQIKIDCEACSHVYTRTECFGFTGSTVSEATRGLREKLGSPLHLNYAQIHFASVAAFVAGWRSS